MGILRFISVKLSICLILGILIGYYIAIQPIFAWALVVVFLIVLTILFIGQRQTKHFSYGLVTGLLTLSLGVLSVSLSQPEHRSDHYAHFAPKKNHNWHIKIREVLKSTPYSHRYTATVLSMDQLEVSGKLLISAPPDTVSAMLTVDDELLVNGIVQGLKTPLNPYQFNYASYMEGLGIYDQIYLNPKNHIVLEHRTQSIYGIASRWRNTIISKLKEADFGSEELSIIQALLLGQRNAISDLTYTQYKDAGAVHILALSGLHIGILLLVLQFILRPLEQFPRGKSLKLIFIVFLLWGFAFLAGLSASIIRAVTMFTFVAYAQYLNRPTNSYNILALSLFFILLLHPMLLFQVGFQMSYAAVFSIIWIYPLLSRLWTPKWWLLQKTWQLLSVSLAAQLGVLPISLFYFHQFPGLFFISNLLIVPFLGLLLILGILIIVLALFEQLPHFLASIYNSAIHLMNTMIAWVAKQEAFLFKNISFDGVQLILSYSIIIFLALNLTKTNYKRILGLSFGIMAMQLWSFYTAHRIQQEERFFIAHSIGNTALIHQKGGQLDIAYRSIFPEKITLDYKIAQHLDTVVRNSLANAYQIGDKQLLIVDSLGVYPIKNSTPDYLLLTQSPKINLDRLIDSIAPKQIIADGSNYRNYITRWKATCLKRKLPFHYTGERGAYNFMITD